MKYGKILGLFALAATALMAFAVAASASVVTSPSGTVSTAPIHAVNSGGHVSLHGPSGSGITIECSSTVEIDIKSHGASQTVNGELTGLSFTGCTNGWVVTVLAQGTVEGHATGGGNGTLTSTGTKVTTVNGAIDCEYTTSNTSIGTLTGGNPGVLDISATIPRTGGSSGIFCGTSGVWTGSYATTSAAFIS